MGIKFKVIRLNTNLDQAYVKKIQEQMRIKKGGKDQESIQSRTTPDPGYHMGKWQNTIKHHKQERRGQA